MGSMRTSWFLLATKRLFDRLVCHAHIGIPNGEACFVALIMWHLLRSTYEWYRVCDTWRVLNGYIGHEVQNFNER